MELKGQGGVVRATIHVTRKATGKVETYEIVGSTDPDQLPALVAEARRNRVHGASGALTGEGAIVKTNEGDQS